jgi:hypothetical protein
VLGEYFTRNREHDRFASARTYINGEQTHDGFDSIVVPNSCCRKPAAGEELVSSFWDWLKFCRDRSVQGSPRLFEEFADVVGLENIAAKEHTGCACVGNISDHIECVLVGGMTAPTQHQNRNGTLFHHRPHRDLIPAVIRLDGIRAQLGCHAGVEVQPLGIAWIPHILPASERFNNQGDSNSFTLARDFGVARNFLHLKIGITRTDDEIGENRIRPEP